jgi:hypothetical protein
VPEPPVRASEVLVALLNVEIAAIQGEVDRATVEQFVEFAVVGLAFAPAGGDRRDLSLDRRRPEHSRNGRPALRTQQCHRHQCRPINLMRRAP